MIQPVPEMVVTIHVSLMWLGYIANNNFSPRVATSTTSPPTPPPRLQSSLPTYHCPATFIKSKNQQLDTFKMSDTHNDPRADAAEHPAVDSNSVDDSVGEPMQVDTEGTVSPPTSPNTYLRTNLLF